MERRHVVLDTNVFVAAGFNPRSASAWLLQAVRDGRLRMAWSEQTRHETERIVRKIPPLRHTRLDDLFRDEDRWTDMTHPERFEFVPDPDDRKFAALAEAAGAVLVTDDDHLLAVRDRIDTDVLPPREAEARFRGTHASHKE